MTRRIHKSIFFTSMVVLVTSFLAMAFGIFQYLGPFHQQQLQSELVLMAAAMEESGLSYLERLPAGDRRYTWIASDGSVLYDSNAEAPTMENHSARQEVQQAFSDGFGSSIRYSTTLTERTIYCAIRLSDSTVLRLSVNHASALKLALTAVPLLLVVALLAALLSRILARWMSQWIVTPLNTLDLHNPLDNESYEELAPMLDRIHQQHLQIQKQLKELQQKTEEFAQITGNMREGLVLLDRQGRILTINPAACQLFGADISCMGQSVLTIDGSPEMSGAVDQALQSGHSEFRAQRGGRHYQFDISRSGTDGQAAGAVLLAFDVTEQELAERRRREFTANVSHELKTPLQSIIGSAELLENQMVKTEDVPRFVGHIRKEAARLVTLIDDIIRLSQMDEGAPMTEEMLDALAVARDVTDALADVADAKGVQLHLQGESSLMMASARLLHELIYNLVDNAIKYNIENGSVYVTVKKERSGVLLSVEDTGIGIPMEHQSRIFERFYRVDKSHSRSSGGTGLGLSIVKHAAQYFNARIDLKSQPGEGTTITVFFPNA